MDQVSCKEEPTKEVILEAALDVIEDRAISGTRLRLIAERANLFQSNIHYYFRSKRELLLAVQKKVLNRCIEIRSALEQEAEDTLDAQLNVFIQQKTEFIRNLRKYDYAEIDFWVQARSDEDIRREFKRSFQNWRSDIKDILRPHAPGAKEKELDLCAAMFVSLLEGATLQYLIDSEAFDLDNYFDAARDAVKARLALICNPSI